MIESCSVGPSCAHLRDIVFLQGLEDYSTMSGNKEVRLREYGGVRDMEDLDSVSNHTSESQISTNE